VNLQRSVFNNVDLAAVRFADVNLAGASIQDANLAGMTIDDVLVSDLIKAHRCRVEPGSLDYVAPVFQVADLQRSLNYYRDCLAFAVEFNHEGWYASVVRDGCRIHLKCSPRAGRDQAAFEAAEHVDVCFGVRDAPALAAAFAAAGAALCVPLRSMPYGMEFYINDPDGYVLGFVQAAGIENV
jgi:predicted enzyme related to lactoylglutathione lyase